MTSVGLIFSRTALLIYDNARLFLAGLLGTLVLACLQLASLKPLDVSLEGLLGRSTPENLAYNEYKRIFGGDEVITFLLSSDDVRSEAFIGKLAALHQDIERRMPGAGQVVSLVNTPIVIRRENQTSVGRAFVPWPTDRADLDTRLQTIRTDHSPYRNAFVNAEGTLSLLFIRLHAPEISGKGGSDPYSEYIRTARQIGKEHDRPGFGIQVTGQATIIDALRQMLVRDLFLLPLAALLASITALLVLFQRKSAVAIPALIMVLPLAGTFSLMAILGYPVQQPTALLPPFIVIISVAGTVHLLTSFYGHFTLHEDKRKALGLAFAEKGTSLLMTSLTTAAGLFSFSFADLDPIANLGLFGTCGTLLTLASTLVVLPVYVRLVRVRPISETGGDVGGIFRRPISRFIEASLHLATRHTRKVLVISLVLLASAAAISMQLRFSHNLLNWLPTQWPVLQASRLADRAFHSAVSIEVMLDSGRPGGVADPEFISRLDALEQSIREISLAETPIGLTISVADYLKSMQEDHLAKAQSYPIDPDATRKVLRDIRLLKLVVPELFSSVVTPDLRYARLSVRTGMTDAPAYIPLLESVRSRARNLFPEASEVTLTGQVSILARTLEALASSAKSSYLLSVGIIALMMALMLRSLRDGIWSLVPNLLPVFLVLASMWVFGIQLDLFTMLVVSIALGLVVDDTIHFMSHFRRNFESTRDASVAARQALHQTGRAMVISTVVLVAGIQFLYLSELHSVGVFGSLTASVMVLGLLADFVVAPAIMIWLYRDQGETENPVRPAP